MTSRMLERLATLDLSDDQIRVWHQQDQALMSIRNHLSSLLNTRAGSVPIDPEYGVPDMSVGPGSSEFPNADVMAQALLAVVARYEQRLNKPRLQIVLSHADNISTRLILDGEIEDGGSMRAISLQATIGGDGVVEFDPIEQG